MAVVDELTEATDEEAAAEDVRGMLTFPTPMPRVVVTGVPLRAAFWYQGMSKRSGMQLFGARVRPYARDGKKPEQRTERPSRSV